MNILKAENISFGYIEKRPILKGLDFEMNNSEVVGLFGDSGSGKSTFCKILTRFIQDYSGKITINNNEIESGFNPVQLIFQHPEKVMNPKWKMNKIIRESWNPTDDILDEFGIKKDWFDRYPSELSGGEHQRFSILRALNPKTQFVIADEITTMLDAVTQVQIWESLLKIAKEKQVGVLVVSHDYNLLNRITDRIVYLDNINNI